MPAKIRLQRHGKKGHPFYHVVIADSRAPRDGKYIEKIGIYDPNTNPATIDINDEKALEWLQVGAQPTNTVNAILKYRGVMYKKHLFKGVEKGAFTEEEANNRFDNWLKEKEAKIQQKRDKLASEASSEAKKRFDLEAEINAKRAGDIASRRMKEMEAVQAKEAESVADVVEEAKAEAVADVVEEAKAETPEAKVAETPEAPAEKAPESKTSSEEEKPAAE